MTEAHNIAVAPQAVQNEGKTLIDYMQPIIGSIHSAIRKPTIAANNFEIKSGILQMVKTKQFGVALIENLKDHIANFVELCDTIKYNGVTKDAIRLLLFSFSLRYAAKSWLNSLPANLITT